jgi:hypothetical protein
MLPTLETRTLYQSLMLIDLDAFQGGAEFTLAVRTCLV